MTNLVIKLTFVLLVFGNGQVGNAQHPDAKKIINEFAAVVERQVNEKGDGCVMIAVFKGNEIVWSKGYGMADVEKKIPATANTIGRTGSISKSFTAVAICQLVERGVLQLDDPIAKHFPEIKNLNRVPKEAKPITYRMLASHTSGLVREPSNMPAAASGPIKLWEQKILKAIPKTSFKSEPLTEYSYSNIGFGILGLAGSRAAEEPFMALVEKQIFEPLEMKSSFFVVDKTELKRLAVGYLRDRRTGKLDSTVPTREHQGRGYKVPNGGIYSTVEDLAKFAAAMLGESRAPILNEKSLKQVFSPQPPAERYGLGFNIISRTDKHLIAGHGGSVAGYRADLRFDLKSKWGVATLRTSSHNPPTRQLLLDLLSEQSR